MNTVRTPGAAWDELVPWLPVGVLLQDETGSAGWRRWTASTGSSAATSC